MGTILIRDVPEELRRALKVLCVQRGTTMQAELLRLIKQEVDRASRKK
jgi:plasmid stability protein